MVQVLKLLVVEDDADEAELFERQLAALNGSKTHVTRVSTLDAALDVLATTRPDCILTDLSLPDSFGVKTVERLAQHTDSVPIVVLTGVMDDTLAVEVIQAGAHGYVYKGEARSGVLSRVIHFAIERCQIERELASAEANLHKLMANSRDGMVLVDSDGIVQFANSAAQTMLSASGRVLIGRPFGLEFNPEQPSENRIVLEDESIVYVETRATSLDWHGESVSVVSLHDISERKRVEAQLLDSERQYRKLFNEMMPGFVLDEVLFDDHGAPCDLRIIDVNPTFEQITGRTREQVVGHRIREVFPRVEDYWIEIGTRVALSGEPEHCEHFASELDKYIEASAFSPQRGLVAFTFVDVTARRQAEEERALLAIAVASAREAVSITGPGGLLEYVNPAWEQLLGIERAKIAKCMSPEFDAMRNDATLYANSLQELSEGRAVSCRFRLKPVDGNEVEVESTISPIRDETGLIAHYAVVSRDITDKLAAESQLRQAQKLEAIGTLAGGIAHDFNNILSAIMGYTELSAQSLPANSPVQQDLGQVLRAAQRAQDLVHQILTFSRQRELAHQPLRVDLTIKEALKLLRASLPSTIEMRTTIAPGLDRIMGDLTQIQQVLMNLCTNAFHAMPDGGVLEVRLDNVRLDESAAKASVELAPGKYVRLTVSDTGHGMDKRTMERIFEPFFTTKAEGKGTGLGLATVHGIVRSHGGTVTVYSEPGKGTTFRVYFPALIRDTAGTEATEDDQKIYYGQGERILLVDDEEQLTVLGKSMLERLGYQPTVFSTPLEALETFAAAPREFHAIIADQTMPRMPGIEFVRKVRELRKDIPVILCTGFSESLTVERIAELGIQEVLRKPILFAELSRAVRQALLSSYAD